MNWGKNSGNMITLRSFLCQVGGKFWSNENKTKKITTKKEFYPDDVEKESTSGRSVVPLTRIGFVRMTLDFASFFIRGLDIDFFCQISFYPSICSKLTSMPLYMPAVWSVSFAGKRKTKKWQRARQWQNFKIVKSFSVSGNSTECNMNKTWLLHLPYFGRKGISWLTVRSGNAEV